VRKAFAQGYLNVVTPGSQLSPSSLEIKWEEELRATIKGASLPSLSSLLQAVLPLSGPVHLQPRASS